MSNKWIVVIFLLFLVIMLALIMGSQNYNGFAFAKSTLTEYPYEGFDTFQAAYESRDGTSSVQSSLNDKSENEKKSETKPKEGFDTMIEQKVSKLTGSTYGDEKPVAFLYNNDANTTCKNYGYTNSKGFICMSDSDIKLLTTRGGNAAGASDQIGK
jgi:hypothetical protein